MVATVFYKLKISLTNFVLRILIRRIGGRAIVKAYLTFTDVLATGAWDAWVAWRMVGQARIRALGPSACECLLRDILRGEGKVRKDVFVAMLRAVATTIVRDRDVHPNLLALMRSIARRAGKVQVKALDDTKAFLEALDALSPAEANLVLEVLVLASFPDGRVSRAEKRILGTILERKDRSLAVSALKRVCKRFVNGDELSRSDLREVIGISRSRQPLEQREVAERVVTRGAAHLQRRRQPPAHRRPLGATEDATAVVVIELDAAHARGLAIGHPGDRRRDRRGDATRPASSSTIHAREISGREAHDDPDDWMASLR